MFTSSPDVHIGDTLTYDVTVFNGITNSSGRVVCDATAIQASLVTPDNVNHPITLVRTSLSQGEFDFYTNVVSYVVRAQDVQPDGTVRIKCSGEAEARTFESESKMTVERVVGLDVPTTVAVGKRDGHDGPHPAHFGPLIVDAMPRARLVDYAHLGHFGPFQDPDTLAEDILATFL